MNTVGQLPKTNISKDTKRKNNQVPRSGGKITNYVESVTYSIMHVGSHLASET